MYKFIFVSLIAGFSSLGFAQGQDQTTETKEVLVNETVHNAWVKLDPSTVICSNADYGATYLKVLIPQLKDLTLLDHRNEGAGAPCVAAGLCKSPISPNGPVPSDILDTDHPNEPIQITVRLVRVQELNRTDQTCKVTLREEIQTEIRGLTFRHARFADLGQRNFEDCQ